MCVARLAGGIERRPVADWARPGYRAVVARSGMGEPRMETPLLVLDLVGTLVFALSGAMAGSGTGFGVLVLSFAAA